LDLNCSLEVRRSFPEGGGASYLILDDENYKKIVCSSLALTVSLPFRRRRFSKEAGHISNEEVQDVRRKTGK
jgi:hypothetical protein